MQNWSLQDVWWRIKECQKQIEKILIKQPLPVSVVATKYGINTEHAQGVGE